MASAQEVAQNMTTDSTQPQQRGDEHTIRPPVDIFEDAHGIMVVAEMPGVSRDRLNVRADRNNLTIEGDAVLDMPKGMKQFTQTCSPRATPAASR